MRWAKRSAGDRRKPRKGAAISGPDGEAAFIAALRAIASTPAARGLIDDAAVIPIGGEVMVATHDMIVEGVHYLAGQDPADVAWRLVATNISDLAAKGARPLGVLLGAMLGSPEENARFIAGLGEALAAYDTPLLGGDTVRGTPQRSYGLTALGLATHRPVPARSGARVGEALWITGKVGAAMAGFEALQAGSQDSALTAPYRRPQARLDEGIALAPHVGAMMDVSDGLLIDAARMARASGVTLAIDSAAVPIAVAEARRADALRWGDDYELLFTAPEGVALPVPAARIGSVVAGDAGLLLDGQALAAGERLGWEH